jgi:hypothetical protein
MYTAISLFIGVIGCFLLYANPPIGILALIIGALFFIRGNRLANQRKEQKRHEELLAAVKAGGGK